MNEISAALTAAANAITDFAPESDLEFLEFVQAVAVGFAQIGEAFDEATSTLTDTVGLDAKAVGHLSNVGVAVTEASSEVATVRAHFEDTYQGIRDTVADGTRLPKGDFEWTGEDAA